MSRFVFCQKLNREAMGLDFPPYPGALGQRIFAHISSEVWQSWLQHQTMLINEYRLNLSDTKSGDFLEGEMEKFLFGTGSQKPAGFTQPSEQ